MAERKDRMALLSRFNKHYQSKYEVKPTYNLWAEQWAADALVDSYGLEYCYDLLEYYFEVSSKPDWKYFSNYAHEIIKAKANKEQDDRERAERRNMARAWLNDQH
jgi:hypothetical protein